MDSSSLNSNGGASTGVSVRKYSSTTFMMNTFLWYFFQTLTVSSMLLMVLSISWTLFSANNNIQVACGISTVAFAIMSPIFIIPNLARIAPVVAIPVLELTKNIIMSPIFQILNIALWMFCGYVYPFAVHLSCYCLIVGIGLLKMYGDGGPGSLIFMRAIGADALGPCLSLFNNEMKHGTGRSVVSAGAALALLGLFVVTLLAYYLPPLVEPEKKKRSLNVAEEAPTPGGSRTNTFETL